MWNDTSILYLFYLLLIVLFTFCSPKWLLVKIVVTIKLWITFVHSRSNVLVKTMLQFLAVDSAYIFFSQSMANSHHLIQYGS